jgi:hypothetical protein
MVWGTSCNASYLETVEEADNRKGVVKLPSGEVGITASRQGNPHVQRVGNSSSVDLHCWCASPLTHVLTQFRGAIFC